MKEKKNKLGFRFAPFRVTPCWGCMLTLHLARVVVYGCCLLGFDKLVSCLLLAELRNLLLCLLSAEEVCVRLIFPTGGEGGLHEYPPLGEWVGLYVYFPLGERVGCRITPHWGRGWVFGLLPTGEVGLMVTSHWGSWFQGYSLLGERVGCMITPH